jgi:predicted aspartyl protease
MSWEFSFSTRLHLSEDHLGLRLPFVLSVGGQEVRVEAYFDTGSTYCVVPREAGERLGLDVEAGTLTTLRTGGGPMPGYLHYVNLTIGDLIFEDVPLCVEKYQGLDRCLLGRAGWLQKVRLGMSTYDEQLYLNPHGQ